MSGVGISRKKARIEKEEAVQIPVDVAVEILNLLPVKSLLRFSFACKTWYSIISHPKFCNKPACVLICEGFKTFATVESLLERKKHQSCLPLTTPWQPEPEPEHRSRNKVLGSCNGFVCVNYISSRWGRSALILWNPSTRNFRKLPPGRVRSNRCNEGTIYAGFGYDESKDDYKFVWMACKDRRPPRRRRRRIEFDVFSLKSKTWRSYNHYRSSDIALFGMNFGHQQCTGVLSNGAIHWIIRYRIFAFDLASEKYRLLESPQGCESGGKVVSLSGCLCFYTGNRMPGQDFAIDLWMRKEYGVDSSWIKLVSLPTTLSIHRIRFDEHYPIYLDTYHPIHFSSEEGSIVAMVEYLIGGERFKIMRLQVKNGAIVGYETLLSVSGNDVTFVLEETLVSAN